MEPPPLHHARKRTNDTMAITAAYSAVVAAAANYDNNHFPETGAFVTHKTYGSKQLSNMLPLPNLKNLFMFALATCCLFGQQCLATPTLVVGSNNSDTTVASAPYPPYECGSMDIRNFCVNFAALENCTVVTGYLLIVLLPVNGPCDFNNNHSFPKLREITDFLLIHDIRNLTTTKKMFPNLTVIRGQRLFLNYALGITNMHQLARLELPSFIAVQRGHIYVASCPKLCFLDLINFDRITLAPGKNHIYPKNATCPPSVCHGCASGCWSNETCQRNENDNTISYINGIEHCHEQCLGGCYNRTAQGCAVCRSWTDNGSCVKECPEDKYVCQHYLRCYTREQCINKNMVIYKMNCVDTCPSGYKLNTVTRECDSCGGVNSCPKICQPHSPNEPFFIYTLTDLERLKGCQIVNTSLFINLRSPIDEKELTELLGDITDIYGHLKIAKSHHLKSLKCFKNLQKIHGLPLEKQEYAIIVFNNRNLRELWQPSENFELPNGGIYIQLNDRLCNAAIKKFRKSIKHDFSKDLIQTSDKDVLCSPAKIILEVEVISHRAIKFSWPKDQTQDEVEIIYRPIPADIVNFDAHSEMDSRVCERNIWQRELVFPSELEHNDTHYSYIADELTAHTKYACLVKTFGTEDSDDARSELEFATTLVDIPKPPMLKVNKKTFNSLAVQLYYDNRDDTLVDYYNLEVYEIHENKEMLDQRDYCDVPMKTFADYHNEDYDDCCSRRLEEKDDDLFNQKLKDEFKCDLDHKEFCGQNSLDDNKPQALLTKRLEHSETNYTIRSLERFQLYTIQVQACNSAGCGSFNILTDRTNYSLAADKIYDLTACKMDENNEYRMHFKEPTKPNGHVTSYIIHFRYFNSSTNGPYVNHMRCLNRLEHERNNYMYMIHLDTTFNQVAVKVESFGRHTFTDWVDITSCSNVQWNTSKASSSSHGWNIFFICFLIGAGGTILWICYKRKYWQKLPQLRRYVPLQASWLAARPEPVNDETDDRQILVEGFDSVRFHNTPEEEDATQLVQ